MQETQDETRRISQSKGKKQKCERTEVTVHEGSEATASGRCPDNRDGRRLDCDDSIGGGDQQRPAMPRAITVLSLNGIHRVASLERKQTVLVR